jgi:hypothetical protein
MLSVEGCVELPQKSEVLEAFQIVISEVDE